MDPRVNIHEAKNYLLKQPANVVTHKSFTATSSSESTTSFRCNPPNPDIVVSRLVYLTMRAKFTFTSNDPAVNILQQISGSGDSLDGIDNVFCPRQFPLASVMRSLKVDINSDSLTVQPYHYMHALAKYHLPEETRMYQLSGTPAQPDTLQNYTQYSGDDQRNPFKEYETVGYEVSRGSYKPYKATRTVINNNANPPVAVGYTY